MSYGRLAGRVIETFRQLAPVRDQIETCFGVLTDATSGKDWFIKLREDSFSTGLRRRDYGY